MKKTIFHFFMLLMICCGLTLAVTKPAIAGDKVNKEALVICDGGKFLSLEKDPNKNEVDFDYSLTWYIVGQKDGNVLIQFVPKKDHPDCKAKSPFASPQFLTTIKKDYGFERIDSKKVDKKEPDRVCYTYQITCFNPDGSVQSTIDPIIDVPKP